MARFPFFKRNENLELVADHKCPDYDDLAFYLNKSEGEIIYIALTSDDYFIYENGVCHLLFRPSSTGKLTFGLGLMEKYALLFDSTDSRIGF